MEHELFKAPNFPEILRVCFDLVRQAQDHAVRFPQCETRLLGCRDPDLIFRRHSQPSRELALLQEIQLEQWLGILTLQIVNGGNAPELEDTIGEDTRHYRESRASMQRDDAQLGATDLVGHHSCLLVVVLLLLPRVRESSWLGILA